MLRYLGKLLLGIGGWSAVGGEIAVPRALVIAAPHTSNWDAVWALAYRSAIGIDIHFFAKHSLFWFPLGNILRALGGIPLDRGSAGSAVMQAVDAFTSNESFYFGLAPEGTRSRRAHWKTGFYRIAMKARVPVILGFIDYGKKRLGLGPTIELTGDMAADLERIAAFYAGIEGRRPDKTSPIRFAPDSPSVEEPVDADPLP